MTLNYIFILFAFVSFQALSASDCQNTFDETKALENNPILDNSMNYPKVDLSNKKYSDQFLKNAEKLSIQTIMSIYPIINGIQQNNIAKEYHETKDKRLFRILYFSNFKLAHNIAYAVSNFRQQNTDDLVQESLIALMQAIEKFNPEKGKYFYPFAKLIMTRKSISYKMIDTNIPVYLTKMRQDIIAFRKANPSEEFGTGAWKAKFLKEYPSNSSFTLNVVLANFIPDGDRRAFPKRDEYDFGATRKEDLDTKLSHKIAIKAIFDWFPTYLKSSVRKNMREKYRIIGMRHVLTDSSVRQHSDTAEELNISRQRVSHIAKKIRRAIHNQFPDLVNNF